mmetsp:Transcript_7164/g.10639  ORF Transcript_7164/g.10639 Transcript_7164/m.10639 type:complete len:321 (+) Transcript_7164:64-1026(+)
MTSYSTAAAAITVAVLTASSSPGTLAFTAPSTSHLTRGGSGTSNIASSSSLQGMKRNKFSKQQELAAKMEEAKRLREQGDGGGATAAAEEITKPSDNAQLSDKEIKERNDRQRFADMLENSMTSSSNGDLGDGYYLTVEQENENAEAVFKGINRLYEGDPAPSSPFTELLNIDNGEPLGQGGMKRLVPWEGSRSASSSDFMIVVTDPRPKSVELRTAMKRLAGALSADMLAKCVVINTDTPAENRRFVKKNFSEDSGADKMTVLTDEKMDWMREYTALGEKRFSISMFILKEGRCEKIAREVEAESMTETVKNAIRGMLR